MSNSLQPHGLFSSRLLCPWNSPGKNTGVDSHSLLQGIFPTQGPNPGLPHCGISSLGFSLLTYQMKIKAPASQSFRETSLVAQMVKHLPTMRETRVQSLGQEDPLEKEMAAHSNILAWKIPWTEEPGRLQSMGSQRVGHN